jgi:hypothetical protein
MISIKKNQCNARGRGSQGKLDCKRIQFFLQNLTGIANAPRRLPRCYSIGLGLFALPEIWGKAPLIKISEECEVRSALCCLRTMLRKRSSRESYRAAWLARITARLGTILSEKFQGVSMRTNISVVIL